jgi:hexosaminidase
VHGELLVRTGDCKGEPVARVLLPATPDADGFVNLQASLPASARTAQGLCLNFSGDTRPTMWVLDQVKLLRAD